MAPTILIGDRIHVDTGYRDIKRGDIIVFNPPIGETGKDYIKRCVAIGGDRFTIRNGSIYVNGEKKDEPYIKGKTGYQGFSDTTLIEGIVPADSYVVLGDNREHSLDSRYFGYVPRSRITGKVLYIWFAYDTKRIGTQL
jgi:signal peptidase I